MPRRRLTMLLCSTFVRARACPTGGHRSQYKSHKDTGRPAKGRGRVGRFYRVGYDEGPGRSLRGRKAFFSLVDVEVDVADGVVPTSNGL